MEVKGKKYTVKEIHAKDARDIVKKYHYSGKVVSNSKLHLGVFYCDSLVGCLQYGPPMNGKKTISKLGIPDGSLELNRMVMADSEPRNSESQAISLCNKYLKRFTDVPLVLSFSDGKEGNVGYIYQATNWKYIGYMLSNSFYELDGDMVHAVTVWHRYKEKHQDRDIKTTDEILCDNFKNIRKITCKQHIYLFDIKRGASKSWRPADYPKVDREIKVLSAKVIKKDGVIVNEKISYTNETLAPAYK